VSAPILINSLVQSASKNRALIVDDYDLNRKILSYWLKASGFEVIEAVDGADAVKKFTESPTDIVFMDVNMPVMDGYEATKIIKAHCQDHFVPIIFVTSAEDEQTLAECIEAGGDDFLSKPFNESVLQSKIQALTRTRDLHRRVVGLYSRINDDEIVAEHIYHDSVCSRNVAVDTIGTIFRSPSTFSGDLMLTAHSPSRDIYILLGDFTGHGLSAALGALPVSEIFHNMTHEGHSPHIILNEINTTLCRLLPANLFMALQFVAIRYDLAQATICVCGMPDVLVVDGEKSSIKHTVASQGFPLGVSKTFDYRDAIERVSIAQGDHILLVSDGLTEACNAANVQFGEQRLKDVVASSDNMNKIIKQVESQLDQFIGDKEQDDDISFVDIPNVPEILPTWAIAVSEDIDIDHKFDLTRYRSMQNAKSQLNFKLKFDAEYLRKANPIPLIVGYFSTYLDFRGHDQTMFIILTELFLNSLDYGLLDMDSSGSYKPKELDHHYKEREKRLKNLQDGFIEIKASATHIGPRMYIELGIIDSGQGFNFKSILHKQKDCSDSQQHRRGIGFLGSICDHIEYQEPGNAVDVIFSWQAVS
jgi:CheY-like chemotaxis protein